MQITGKTTITLKDKSLDGNCVHARYFANHLRQTRHLSQRRWGGGGTSHISYPEDQKMVVMWGM